MDQPAQKAARLAFDELSLPVDELNGAGVLHAGAMLRQQLGPIPRVERDDDHVALRVVVEPGTPPREDPLERAGALVDDRRIHVVEKDPQLPAPPTRWRDIAVPQIDAE